LIQHTGGVGIVQYLTSAALRRVSLAAIDQKLPGSGKNGGINEDRGKKGGPSSE